MRDDDLSWLLADYGEVAFRRVPVYVDGYNEASSYPHKIRGYCIEIEVDGFTVQEDSLHEAVERVLEHFRQ